MGGSGGGYFKHDPRQVLGDVEEAQRETRNEAYEAECNDLLNSYLVDFNDRDREAIARHLREIREALGKELEGMVDLRFAGSVAKHTYVDGLSDVDALVMLDRCELADRSPAEAKEYLATRLQERFPRTEITAGRLAITVRFSDAEIQLLPAVSCRTNVKIADPTGTTWSEIRPREFSRVLTEVNQQRGNKVVPVVKLAKAIIANLPESHRISGYHAESLAVNLFRGYDGPLRSKDMLKHFFAEGAQTVLGPIRDRTGQSVHVDDYLGAPSSVRRRLVSDAFNRVARRMSNADAAASVDQWQNLLGG